MKHLDVLFSLFVTASLASTVILLFLFLIQKMFHKRLSPKVTYMLWFLVLIKLLIPIAPQSEISLFNLMPQATPVEWMNSNPRNMLPEHSITSSSSKDAPSARSDEKQAPAESNLSLVEQTVSTNVTPAVQEQTNAGEQIDAGSKNKLNWLRIGSLVWLVGFLILCGYYLSSTVLFRLRVRDSHKIDDDKLLLALAECSTILNIKRQIQVYETSFLRSPCLYGLWKPRIYVPEDIIAIADSRQLSHILLHELTHYKRMDLWFNALWMLSVGLHWYNPMVWLAVRKMKADQEVACDASVLESLDEPEASSYGMTLLMLSRLFSRQVPPYGVNLSHFGNNKNETKRRIIMIAKFKKGSYKLSAIAILFVVTLGAVFLTNANTEKSSEPDVKAQEGGGSTKIEIPPSMDKSPLWFHSLGRALDYKKFDFKVPDYVPESYQLEHVVINESSMMPDDPERYLKTVTISFVSNFGTKNERKLDVVAAAAGRENMLEHGLLAGAHYSRLSEKLPEYRQEPAKIGNVRGILFTDKRAMKNRPETGKSFYWNDHGVWYAVNYYSEHMSQEELGKMVQSFVSPQQVQHVRYDGEGNSFNLYDEKDLAAAENILGFKAKLPVRFKGIEFRYNDIMLMRANDQNTGFPFRPAADRLWTRIHGPLGTTVYDKQSGLEFYQSKVPLYDTNKLTFIRNLTINNVEITAYADNDQVYDEPSLSEDKTKKLSLVFYLWEQDNIHYAAIFDGIDEDPEKLLKTLVMTPLQ